MIAQRLASVSDFSGKFKLLPPDEVQSRLNGLRPFLDGLAPTGYKEIRRFDARDTDTFAVADWLRAQGISDEPVKVFWLSEREGISINLSDFLDFFDELWFPSSDDVIVEAQSKTFVIVINHEEQVQLFLA